MRYKGMITLAYGRPGPADQVDLATWVDYHWPWHRGAAAQSRR